GPFCRVEGVPMFVRRGQAAVRLGAGLLLAMTCAAAPAVVLAPPAAGDVAGSCTDAPPSTTTDAESYEVDSTVTITGTCFKPYEMAKISIIPPDADGPVSLGEEPVSADGTVTSSYPATDPGDFGAVIKVEDSYQQADARFTVTDAEEPTPGDGGEGDTDKGDTENGSGDEDGGSESGGENGSDDNGDGSSDDANDDTGDSTDNGDGGVGEDDSSDGSTGGGND